MPLRLEEPLTPALSHLMGGPRSGETTTDAPPLLHRMEAREKPKTLKRPRTLPVLFGFALLFSGCGKQGAGGEPNARPSAREPSAPAAPETVVTTGLATAHKSLSNGAVDEAAAELTRIQMSAASFNPQEAAAYRQTLGEAYSRALQAIEKGDPRGQAALEMIRGIRPR